MNIDWGIVNPAEMIVGVGMILGIAQLFVSCLFWLFFLKPGQAAGRGWSYDGFAALACIAATGGLLAVFVVPIFYHANEVPFVVAVIMACGLVLTATGLLVQCYSLIRGREQLLQPRGERELSWARKFIAYVPLSVVAVNLLQLYQLLGVH